MTQRDARGFGAFRRIRILLPATFRVPERFEGGQIKVVRWSSPLWGITREGSGGLLGAARISGLL